MADINGTAAIVCFPGIMYRGGAEKKIRQYLIDNNFIDCIIQLPSNLFFGTSIDSNVVSHRSVAQKVPQPIPLFVGGMTVGFLFSLCVENCIFTICFTHVQTGKVLRGGYPLNSGFPNRGENTLLAVVSRGGRAASARVP